MAVMVNGRGPSVTRGVEVFSPETGNDGRTAGNRRATAQVASPLPTAFSTTSSSASISAAASATDGVPTAPAAAPDGLGTRTVASAAAGYVTTGTPSRAAAPTIPGSSAFASTVATSTTSAVRSPAPCRVSSIRPYTSPSGAPRRAPTPTTRFRAPGSGVGVVMAEPAFHIKRWGVELFRIRSRTRRPYGSRIRACGWVRATPVRTP